MAIVGGGNSEEQAATEDQYEDEPLSRGFFADPVNRVDLGDRSERAAAFVGYLASPFLVTVIGLAVSQWAIHGSRLWLAILVVGIVALFAFSGLFHLLQLLLPRSRAAIAAMTRRWPWYDRFVWICAFVVWPTAGFAGVAALLSPHGVLELRADRHDGSTWHLFEAYAWNLADAVPVLKVSQTLNWGEPLTF